MSFELGAGMNTLVGTNNCGKSNVLRAVALALDPHSSFSPDMDNPGPRPFAHPIVTLSLCTDGDRTVDQDLIDAARAYERSLGDHTTNADDGRVVLQVSFEPTEDGTRRREVLMSVSGTVPSRTESMTLLDQALLRLREAVRFVLISSGESIRSVLEGNFREILHSVVRERLSEAFDSAEESRARYLSGIQTASIVIDATAVNTAVLGSYSVTYDVTDTSGNPAVQVTRTVDVVDTTVPVNIAPVARPDGASTDEDTDIVIDVLANDTDADGDTLTIESFTQPSDRATTGVGGEIVYTPPADWSGTATFSYVIGDGRGGTDSATVTVVVVAVNDTPTIENPGDQRSLEGDQVSLTVAALDIDGDTLEYGATGLPSGLSIDPLTGIITGTITAGASADSPYSVAVTVLDDGTPTLGAAITFTWEIAPQPPVSNRPPNADDDPITLDSYAATLVHVLANTPTQTATPSPSCR